MQGLDIALKRPGLFITGTDTGVGKTLVSCAIASVLSQAGLRVGVCKPLATGCRRGPGGEWLSEDAGALARFAGCDQPHEIICPIRYEPPMSPAAAAELTGKPVDLSAIARALRRLDDSSDALLIEGIGGALTPILQSDPQVTVLDLIAVIGYPVVVVCRAGLGTLNHTAMTVRLLRSAGCRIAGLVVNHPPGQPIGDDPSMASNERWLVKMNDTKILATIPALPQYDLRLADGVIWPEAMDAMAATQWLDWLELSEPISGD